MINMFRIILILLLFTSCKKNEPTYKQEVDEVGNNGEPTDGFTKTNVTINW